MRFKGERLELLQSRLDAHEPHSGFQWRSLEARPVERPAPASTYVLALEELIAALEGTGALRSDGAVGRRSLELVAAVYQSQAQGNRPVQLPLAERGSGVAVLRRHGWLVDRQGAS
jgi:predicted dehydrogenase